MYAEGRCVRSIIVPILPTACSLLLCSTDLDSIMLNS